MTAQTIGPFCHLHNHSEYSLLDGAMRIQELVDQAKAWGQKAVALTDHGNMYGAIEFYSTCQSAGIKPLIGCEIFHEGLATTRSLMPSRLKEPGRDAFHLVLLARNRAGYHALMRIVSYGYLHNDKEVPIVLDDDLNPDPSELIALSGCLRGEFGCLVKELCLKASDPLAALKSNLAETKAIKEALSHHVEVFKKRFDGHYYIELIDNNLPLQKKLIPYLASVAKYFGLPIVASADAHYLREDFKEAHMVLTAIKNDLTLSKLRDRNRDATFHLRAPEEMNQIFQHYPEALENTTRIAELCDVTLEFGKFFLPDFHIEGEDIEQSLRRISHEGLNQRLQVLKKHYGEKLSDEAIEDYRKRLDYELDVIIAMGFPGYFLIVQDFINWAKDHDIPVGPGRGSGAGSLVAYALRITDLDPIPLNLIFERFLNPERISMPDFDVDFCQSRRDEVIRYVTHKYGAENVAQITTFGKLKAKAALRDVGRVLEISYPRVDRIAKLVPNELDITLDKALEQEPRLKEEAQNDSRINDMIQIALKIEGLSRHTSVHAAGVVISNGAMENFVPVYRGEDGTLVTQYEMKNAEKVGLVKFDFLGLKTLTVVKKAEDIIRATTKADFDINEISLEDPAVYQEISSGHTCGIFQLESSGMQALNLKLKPSCFEDIIAVVALFRPGPLGSGMVDDFIERKHGRQKIIYPLAELEPILKDTYGIILYQEQVQKIASTLASYSLGEADLLRRAMGKKKPEEMAKQKSRFLEGALRNKIDEKIADDVFELMAKFASYGFNKSHSAAYGLVSYQTAYLKTHYPAEFMAAIMTCDLDNTDKLVRYVEECRRLKFTLLPPSINTSSLEFTVPKEKTICFGMAAIKGIGANSLAPLLQEREQRGPFQSLTELAKRVNLHKVGKKTLELLTDAGAMDSFGVARSALFSTLGEIVKYSEHHHEAKRRGQGLLFAEDADETSLSLADWEDRLNQYPFHGHSLAELLKEKKALGVFLSAHPLDRYPEDRERLSRHRLKQIPELMGEKKVPFLVFLQGISERYTKSGKKMAYLQLEDDTASFEAMMFQQDFPPKWPETDSLVVIYANIQKSFDGQSLSFRLDQIVPLETVRREVCKKVWFEIFILENQPPKPDVFVHLNQILTKYRGNTPFGLKLNFGNSVVRIKPESHLIDPSEACFMDLKNLLPKSSSMTWQ